jgi:hypothetical protein
MAAASATITTATTGSGNQSNRSLIWARVDLIDSMQLF